MAGRGRGVGRAVTRNERPGFESLLSQDMLPGSQRKTRQAAADRKLGRATLALGRKDFARCIALCEEVLARDATRVEALHLLAVARSSSGDADAMSLFDLALALSPDNPEILNNRGSALVGLGRPAEGLEAYERAIQLKPDFAEAFNNAGCVLFTLQRLEEALNRHGLAVVLSPDNAEYVGNLGRVFTRLRRYDEALACYEDAINIDPAFTEAILNRAKTLEELKCFNEAVDCYTQALAAGADDIDTRMRRSGALNAAKRHEEALAEIEGVRAIDDKPDLLLAWSSTVANLGRLDEALDGFDRALELGVKPVDVHINRCLVLNNLNRLDEALWAAEQAVEAGPDNADAHNAHGLVLMNRERFDDAITSYRRALALRPDFPSVEWNLAYLSLLRGQFVDGWKGYEARRRQEGTRWTRLDGPEWQGEPLTGKRILLYGEQAFGDTIQFARYVGLLARMGATVILGIYAPLAALFRRLDGAPEVALPGQQTPLYHYHMPLMSVPGLLRHDEADTPAAPYLSADPTAVADWANRLPGADLRVGIAWEGSGSMPGRSIPLEAFAPLSFIPGVSLISLQKGRGVEQLDSMPLGMKVATLGPDFDSGPDAFLDTAAVMMNLDVVVSCDTSVAHLAGALGRPLFIVLKQVPDWRWMLERTDSPWYPTARLFRANPGEDWQPVMNRVAAALATLVRDRDWATAAGGKADLAAPVP